MGAAEFHAPITHAASRASPAGAGHARYAAPMRRHDSPDLPNESSNGLRLNLAAISPTRWLLPLLLSLLPLTTNHSIAGPERAGVLETVIEAHASEDAETLERIASGRGPDAWQVCFRLLLSERSDVAKAVAAAAPVAERPALRAALAASAHDSGSGAEAWRRLANAITASRKRGSAIETSLLSDRDLSPLARAAAVLDWNASALPSLPAIKLAAEAARSIGWTRAEKHLALAESDHHVAAQSWIAGAQRATDVLALITRSDPEWIDGALYQRHGRCSVESGDISGAIRSYQLAAALFAKAGSAVDAAFCQSSVASLLQRFGALTEAHALHRRALTALASERAKRGSPLLTEATHAVRMRIATTLQQGGMVHQSRSTLGELRDDPTLSPRLMPHVLGNLARVEFLADDLGAALAALDASDAAWESQPGRAEGQARVLVHRAWMLAGRPESEVVVGPIQKALRDEWEDASLVAGLRSSLARVQRGLGRWEEALANLRTAQQVSRSLPPESTKHADLTASLGVTLAGTGRYGEAMREIDAFIQHVVGNVSGAEMGTQKTFRGLVAAEALQAGIKSALAVGDVSALWRYLEAGRGIRLLAALGGRSSLEAATVPAALTTELERARTEELNAQIAVRKARSSETPNLQQVIDLLAAATRAERRRDDAARRVSEARSVAERGELTSSAALLPLRRVAQHLADDHAMVSLSLALEGDDLLALVATKFSSRIVRLKNKSSIRAGGRTKLWKPGARGLDVSTDGRSAAPRPPSLSALRELLVAPLKLEPSITSVTIVPDGDLAYLPYSALFDTRNVSVAPSGTVLARLAGHARRTGTHGLALADPDGTSPKLRDQLQATAALVPVSAQRSYRDLAPLPGARKEANWAVGTQGTKLVGAHATIANLHRQLAEHGSRRWRTLHFGCHGFVHGDTPTMSGLALADGMLKARDVLGLRLHTDLVVLAACETATDPFVSGEGISGLVRAFLYAGAPRVLATLWKIPDDASAELMREFYAALDNKRVTVAEALRAAQTHVRKRWPSPYYWAGWTLWGLH